MNDVKTTHTPTPWKMEQEVRTFPKRLVEDKKGITSFYIDGETFLGLPVRKVIAQCEYLNKTDAQIILERVNSYDRLKASHAELLETAKCAGDALIGGDEPIKIEAIKQLKQAIAKAAELNKATK